jgi:hypothetical protein
VVLAGTVAADPVQRRMPSGDEVTELRLSVPEAVLSPHNFGVFRSLATCLYAGQHAV